MANWVSGASVKSQYGLSNAILGQKLGPDCLFIRKPKGRIEVDIDSPDFQSWIQRAVEKSAKHKAQHAIASGYFSVQPESNSFGMVSATANNPASSQAIDPKTDIAQLAELAQRAKLEEPILKNEGYRLKHEQERIKLEQSAGNLIEWQLAEFLFVGYCERINTETLMFPKKFEPKVEHLIDDNLIRSPVIHTIENEAVREAVLNVLHSINKKYLVREITKMNIRELEEIIRTVKQAQSLDVENWKEERTK